MTQISWINIGRKTRALAAALAIGTAVLGLAPGQTAFAASQLVNDTTDVNVRAAEGGMEVSAKPKPKTPAVKYCYVQYPDGSYTLYLPGDTFNHPEMGTLKCGSDGKWSQARTGEVVGPEIGTGGVYAP